MSRLSRIREWRDVGLDGDHLLPTNSLTRRVEVTDSNECLGDESLCINGP